MKMEIEVLLLMPGVHQWVDAPQSVMYLRVPHPHVFHVRCRKVVTHSDRDVEFHILQGMIRNFFEDTFPKDEHGRHMLLPSCEAERPTMSCEQLAVRLIEEFDLSYCSVYEDGENGAIVQR